MINLLHGDAVEQLSTLPAQSVQCVITSPPYWRLRRYTDDAREIGQEGTIAEYVAALVGVFDQVWCVLRDDGTLWLNLGDSYARDGGTDRQPSQTAQVGSTRRTLDQMPDRRQRAPDGLPPKSLMGMPWRVAFALQDRGWVLRSEIIWEKPNGMPENVQDRPARSHETIFLFTKRPHYFYDAAAIAEPAVRPGDVQTFGGAKGRAYTPTPDDPNYRNGSEQWGRAVTCGDMRNARSVWRFAVGGIPDEHYAPFPDELARRCILAGSRPGDTVLDPFVGSGTTCRVAESLGRHSIGIDLAYQELQERRTDNLQIDMRAFL